ncbi:MAG: transglutaminase family protein [Clostridiales bacterium]|nr:transglutaminase family protein [Clostridiales bacterium]
MKELLFEYDMNLEFSPPVEEHRFTLKCIPQTDERQLIKQLDVEVYPKEFLSADEDSFGNYSIYGYTKGKHDRFFARVRGQAQTGLAPYLTAKEEHQIGLFKYQTDYTRPGPAIRAFADTFADAAAEYETFRRNNNLCTPESIAADRLTTNTNDLTVDPAHSPAQQMIGNAPSFQSAAACGEHLQNASRCSPRHYNDPDTLCQDPVLHFVLTMMRALHDRFSYVQGVTDVQTTAEEAMALGKGVCQDYSHILLSLCRMHRIPCRYVVGMLIGEGLSHAWVEVCSNGRWYAFDPTNNLIVDDAHIKISAGRDYHDCIVSQGVFVGRTTQTQTVAVRVREANI